jgi:hypothetical protein
MAYIIKRREYYANTNMENLDFWLIGATHPEIKDIGYFMGIRAGK